MLRVWLSRQPTLECYVLKVRPFSFLDGTRPAAMYSLYIVIGCLSMPQLAMNHWSWSILVVLGLANQNTTLLGVRQTPYLSALDVCKIPFWNIEFDELDFWSISNWNFAGYTGSKYQVQTGKKNQVHQTWYFKLEFCKNQGQIHR